MVNLKRTFGGFVVLAMVSGCGDDAGGPQSVAAPEAQPGSTDIAPVEVERSAQADNTGSPAPRPPAVTVTEPEPQRPQTAQERAAASQALHQAAKTAPSYEVIGIHTHNLVELGKFWDAAGWTAVIDGMTWKTCPDGYEIFCQWRDVFVNFYEQAGGDPDTLIKIARLTDFREPLYRLAAATDRWEQQHAEWLRSFNTQKPPAN